MMSLMLQNPKCVVLSVGINVTLLISSALVIGLNWETVYKTVFSSPNSHRAMSSDGNVDNPNTDSVCVSCDHLGEQVRVNDTAYADIVRTNCGHKLCCLNDKDIVEFLKATVGVKGNKSQSKPSLDWWRNRQNAAHFYLNRSSPVKDDRLQWTLNDSMDTAFARDIDLNSTHLTVKSPGYYFVYVVTTFTDKQGTGQLFYQALENTRKYQLLFDKSSGQRQQTNIMVGIFRFYQESISVRLGDALHLVDTSSISNNYIGIYKLHIL